MTLDTSRPFTRAEALAAGISPFALAGPAYQRLFHGVYVSAQRKVQLVDRAAAALRVCPPGSFVSHHTAATLWRGWVPDSPEVHVSVAPGAVRSKRQGIWAHQAAVDAVPVRHRGLLLSSPIQVFTELAGTHVDLVDLVVFGDSMIKVKRLTVSSLVAEVTTWTGRGARLARRAAQLVREGVDSAPESRLRLLLVLAGLPEPEVNWIIRGDDGEWLRRFDLCYPELRIIIEYDGRAHAESSQQWNSDILRWEQLERRGWTVIVITADALFRQPEQALARIVAVLRERGCTALPRALKPSWERHFPSRVAA